MTTSIFNGNNDLIGLNIEKYNKDLILTIAININKGWTCKTFCCVSGDLNISKLISKVTIEGQVIEEKDARNMFSKIDKNRPYIN